MNNDTDINNVNTCHKIELLRDFEREDNVPISR